MPFITSGARILQLICIIRVDRGELSSAVLRRLVGRAECRFCVETVL